MNQRHNHLNSSLKKPSRFLRLIALCIAFSLPFVLVNYFSHPNKANITNQTLSLPKINHSLPEVKPASAQQNEWQVIKTREGDSLAFVFKRLGLSAKNLHDVLKDNPHAKTLTTLKPNQHLQFLIKENRLEKMIIPFTTTQFIEVYRNDHLYRTKISSRKMNSHNHYLTAKVDDSLYGTAKRLNIPFKLIRQMSEIFNWEIDFSKDVRVGDQFTIIYKAYYIEDKLVGTGDILAVTYINRGKRFQAIRHQNKEGEASYYTPQGESLNKAFTRYPIQFSHISSTFSSSRNHPVLHYKRAHKGIDLAASLGTPIHATGDGIIETIARNNGYGNMIKIRHNKTYSTLYAHMLKFQKGLSKGSKVKRGQIIGFVGQTGLATGPHCHYEFHMDHHQKNPSTVSLPRAASVPKSEMALFKSNSTTLLAHLKLFEEAYLASADKKGFNVG